MKFNIQNSSLQYKVFQSCLRNVPADSTAKVNHIFDDLKSIRLFLMLVWRLLSFVLRLWISSQLYTAPDLDSIWQSEKVQGCKGYQKHFLDHVNTFNLPDNFGYNCKFQNIISLQIPLMELTKLHSCLSPY